MGKIINRGLEYFVVAYFALIGGVELGSRSNDKKLEPLPENTIANYPYDGACPVPPYVVRDLPLSTVKTILDNIGYAAMDDDIDISKIIKARAVDRTRITSDQDYPYPIGTIIRGYELHFLTSDGKARMFAVSPEDTDSPDGYWFLVLNENNAAVYFTGFPEENNICDDATAQKVAKPLLKELEKALYQKL